MSEIQRISAPEPADQGSERIVRPEFSASALEYFRIWIVNLFFTLVTLGVYSAWAKVRKKRYFYGCTRLDGDTFDYLANPKAILKGRIFAAVLFVVYVFSVELYPMSTFGFWAVFLLMLPWLVVRTLTFNAHNSAWRGLRFEFAPTRGQAARMYIGMPIVVLLTAGLAFPWFMARHKAFVISHHALGRTRFQCQVSADKFYATYILSGLLLIVLVVPIVLLIGFAVAALEVPENMAWIPLMLPVALMYAAYALAYALVQARTTNLMWSGAHGPGLRFESTLRAGRLAYIYISNVLAAAATVGLLIPWGVVRTKRYRLENFSVAVEGENLHEANPALERVGAVGQEFGDIFNLDFGL